MPRLGMGTWHMGESRARRAAEVAALRLGLDLGMRLIDTAEMYGEGGAEEVVGEAIARPARRGLRGQQVLSAPRGAASPCARPARRRSRAWACERIDCYLYHWRGPVPLQETVATLDGAGGARARSRRWGVSNFDVGDLEELVAVPGGDRVAANQVLYNLAHARHRVRPAAMVRRARRRRDGVFAARRGAPHWPSRLGSDRGAPRGHARAGGARLGAARARVCAIPKAAREEHVRANRAAADFDARCRCPGRARQGISAAAPQNGARDDLKSAPGDSDSPLGIQSLAPTLFMLCSPAATIPVRQSARHAEPLREGKAHFAARGTNRE